MVDKSDTIEVKCSLLMRKSIHPDIELFLCGQISDTQQMLHIGSKKHKLHPILFPIAEDPFFTNRKHHK